MARKIASVLLLSAVALTAAGCGGAMKALRTQGAADLGCPAVETNKLGEATVAVIGCGCNAVYTRAGDYYSLTSHSGNCPTLAP